MRDVIFVSLENWDEVWRRNQFFCSKLAKKYPGTKILFVAPARDVSYALRTFKFERLKDKAVWSVPEYPNITVTSPLEFFPDSIKWGQRLNENIARAHVRKIARAIGIHNPILWLNPHSAVHMAGAMGESLLIYDITDDWTKAGFSERVIQLISYQDRLLCEKADLVIVCSKALEAGRRDMCKKIILLPNGVDPEHYKSVLLSAKNGTLPKWPYPVFGYTGTIHPDRVDISIIKALARAFPSGSVVLVGPNYFNSKDMSSLSDENNIYLTGKVPYETIPCIMTGFDVCIVPHLETAFTESLNPIKLWEYLACGKPIASTNIAGFRDYPDMCHIGSGPEKFISACRDALHEHGELGPIRINEAKRNSWDERIDRLVTALSSLER